MTAPKAVKEEGRRTGKTTRQMQAAPKGSVFVWCNSMLSYPRRLAKELGRDDLVIVGPGFLDERSRGRRASSVIVDHAARLRKDQADEIAILAMSGGPPMTAPKETSVRLRDELSPEMHDGFEPPILQMDLRCLHCGAQGAVRVTKRADGTVFAACRDCIRVCPYCAAQFSEPRR